MAGTDTRRALGDGGSVTRVLAGDCTVIFDGEKRREHRGHVTTVVKPDGTVLVHDAEGYQPVAWLTRADSVSCSRGGRRSDASIGDGGEGPAPGSGVAPSADAGFRVDARDGRQRLLVVAHVEDGYGVYPATPAGVPVGSCPDCGGTLVRAGGGVTCLECPVEHGLPAGAAVRDERCSCGLPRLRVERGAPFDVCLDRECDPLVDAVRERFDREWTCPDCGSDLRVLRRGGLLAGCDAYPDCEAAFSIPSGTVAGECDCGLPVFEVGGGRRCLDGACERSG